MEKRSVGHPPVYKDTYPDQMVEWMRLGYSNIKICSLWDIAECTFYRWLNEKPELEEAYGRGKMHRERYHEDIGDSLTAGTIDGKHSFSAWIARQNRYAGWAKYSKEGDAGTTINIGTMNVLPKGREELIALVQSQAEDLKDIIDIPASDITEVTDYILIENHSTKESIDGSNDNSNSSSK